MNQTFVHIVLFIVDVCGAFFCIASAFIFLQGIRANSPISFRFSRCLPLAHTVWHCRDIIKKIKRVSPDPDPSPCSATFVRNLSKHESYAAPYVYKRRHPEWWCAPYFRSQYILHGDAFPSILNDNPRHRFLHFFRRKSFLL